MSIESVSDDGFIITVMTNSFDSNSDDIIFLKGDINGEKEWAYVTGTNGHDKGISIIKNSNGYFIVHGHSDSFTPEYLHNTCLIKFSKDGELLNSTIHFVDQDELAYSVTMDEYAGELYVAGDTYS